jgi:hypothetical protein
MQITNGTSRVSAPLEVLRLLTGDIFKTKEGRIKMKREGEWYKEPRDKSKDNRREKEEAKKMGDWLREQAKKEKKEKKKK